MVEFKGKILAGKILVKGEEVKSETSGGIIIPESAKEKPQIGVVVLVGASRANEIMEVVTGDTVLYGKNSGIDLNIDGVCYLLMNQVDVMYIM